MTDPTMTDAERQVFLASIGLNPDAAALTVPVEPLPTPIQSAHGVRLAPDDVDPHTMPAAEIVFDPRLLDGFPQLTGDGLKRASQHVFALYQSRGRDKDRHSLLHRRITEFIGQVRRSRDTGGYVREQIKATKEQRDIAALLAAKNITMADLAALLTAMPTTDTEA